MNSDRGLIGLYWSAREESLDRCAQRSFQALSCLREHGFSSLYRLGRTRKEASRSPFELSLPAIRQLLKQGVNRAETGDRKPIPELGFSFSLWSGGDDDYSYGISSYCGSYSPYVGNNFLVRLPALGSHSLPSLLPVIPALFRQLLEIWKPDRAIVCDCDMRWDNGEFARDMNAYLRYPP
ncbi:MAG TPA: Imm52 family immunity protein [Verrucomicrobiae bacterium]|nr:Imm52 family immunity protein [Verrucomicrobiae bacterium]